MIEIRKRSAFPITYILITKESSHDIFIPEEFRNNVLDLLPILPRDIFQLFDSEKFYLLVNYTRHISGIEFHVVYSKDFNDTTLEHFQPNGVSVFLLDEYSEEIINRIQKQFSNYYVYPVNKEINESIVYNHPDIKHLTFQIPEEFIEFIKRDRDKIIKNIVSDETQLKMIENKFLKVQEADEEDKVKMPNYTFRALKPNYTMLNQIFGNIWRKPNQNEVDLEHKKRQKVLTDQSIIIDEFYYQANYKQKTVSNKLKHLLNPIVLVFPYHNPKYASYFRSLLRNIPIQSKDVIEFVKAVLQKYYTEQNIEYEHMIEYVKIKNNDQLISQIRIEYEESNFLDALGYLHASFTYSPTMRFPIIGKSLNQSLAPFTPEKYYTRNDTKNVYNDICTFGNKLVQLTMEDYTVEYLKNRPGQVVSISDLPTEWLTLKDIPLAFTHDVCRVPISTPSRIMTQYVTNMNFEYTITKDIFKKTLIIQGSPEDEIFKNQYSSVRNLLKDKPQIGIVTTYKKKDLFDAIRDFKPELLIYDTHGGFDKEDLSSYLYINGEKLIGSEIVHNNLSAPLVYLSACFTNPTYGYTNSIAHAFFEAGALSVTTSLLPIHILTGTVLYLRLINNLELASSEAIHPNWLAFICHCTRTSILTQALNRLTVYCEKHDIDYKEVIDKTKYSKYSTEWLTNLMDFRKRREAFLTWKEVYTNSSREDMKSRVAGILNHEEIIPEFLFYSHLGRPDLISFQSYNGVKNNKAHKITTS